MATTFPGKPSRRRDALHRAPLATLADEIQTRFKDQSADHYRQADTINDELARDHRTDRERRRHQVRVRHLIQHGTPDQALMAFDAMCAFEDRDEAQEGYLLRALGLDIGEHHGRLHATRRLFQENVPAIVEGAPVVLHDGCLVDDDDSVGAA
jgi:hypothetical protein